MPKSKSKRESVDKYRHWRHVATSSSLFLRHYRTSLYFETILDASRTTPLHFVPHTSLIRVKQRAPSESVPSAGSHVWCNKGALVACAAFQMTIICRAFGADDGRPKTQKQPDRLDTLFKSGVVLRDG